MMNILYVWFPASWGPSVVEAIQTRNVTCLAKKLIVRNPHIFDRKEAARGLRAREVTCRIQKWNIKAEGFHPILVANARVDWLAMDDDDITKKFPILLEGILQYVYSQRAASAWQGAQPQKLTVSMLLPGTSSAAEWRDLLQSRRQFWPTLTTRHASLVPVSAEALQRERRQMQAKHLWYNVDIRWSDLKDKLEVLAPTGLTREDIWRHLFLTKQRKNPYEEGCYTGEDVEDVKQKWEDKKHYFELYKKDVPRPPCIHADWDSRLAEHVFPGNILSRPEVRAVPALLPSTTSGCADWMAGCIDRSLSDGDLRNTLVAPSAPPQVVSLAACWLH